MQFSFPKAGWLQKVLLATSLLGAHLLLFVCIKFGTSPVTDDIGTGIVYLIFALLILALIYGVKAKMSSLGRFVWLAVTILYTTFLVAMLYQSGHGDPHN